MAILRVAPTKGTLIRIREELALARSAHELLERKREVLINDLMRYVHQMRESEEKFQAAFTGALQTFRTAAARLGEARTRQATDFEPAENEFEVLHRSVMGVHIVELTLEAAATQPLPGVLESVPEIDKTARELRDALPLLADYVTKISSVWRLASEVKKTTRRVNALENIFIPQYEETRDYIVAVLEENDREEFFRQKRVKSYITAGAD